MHTVRQVMTWRDVEPTWSLVIGALSVFQLDCLSTIWVSCFFVIWDCIQVFVGYEPGLLFVRVLYPVPRIPWLACVWKTVIRLPMFPVYAISFTLHKQRTTRNTRTSQKVQDFYTLLRLPCLATVNIPYKTCIIHPIYRFSLLTPRSERR